MSECQLRAFTIESLRDEIANAIIDEMNDPRNRVEHPGFRDGMMRARIVVNRILEKQATTK